MTTENEKLVQYRLSVLEIAKSLGDVSKACKLMGMGRTQFYKYKRRYEIYGLEGLKNLPPIHKYHPMTTPHKIGKQIISLSINHPQWGCYRISDHLTTMDISVSGPTIQKILTKNELGTRYQRALNLQEKWFTKEIKHTDEQISFIEKVDPCFRERHIESVMPGGLLAHHIFSLGKIYNIGKAYMQIFIDTYCGYSFIHLHTEKSQKHFKSIINNQVLPQYNAWKLPINRIIANNNPEFYGNNINKLKHFLSQLYKKHLIETDFCSLINGFTECFYITIMSEFLRKALRKRSYASIQSLQVDINRWLTYYNYEREHSCYRYLGNKPIELIKKFTNNE